MLLNVFDNLTNVVYILYILIVTCFRPKTELDNTDQSAVPSIAPPPKVPTSLFQEAIPSRFNPFDQEPSETSFKNQG